MQGQSGIYLEGIVTSLVSFLLSHSLSLFLLLILKLLLVQHLYCNLLILKILQTLTNSPLSLSMTSIIYPVIGAPLSLIGFSHLSLTDFSSQSTISGRPGGAGTSYGFLARVPWSVSSGSDSPSSFKALTRNWYVWPGSRPGK